MTNPRAARAARRRRIRHLVIGGILFALLAGLALNLRLMLDPQEIRRRATDALAELFVGPVSLERAEVRLPNTVILHGVEVRRARDDPEPALVVSRVHVRFSVISLLIGRSLPRRITFDGPSLDMERRADGTLDLTDLLRPREPEETVETLPRILLRDGQLRLRDDRVLGPDRVLEVTSVWLQGDPDGAFEGGGTVEGLGRLAFRADWRGSAWARLDGVRLEAPLERYLASRHVAPSGRPRRGGAGRARAPRRGRVGAPAPGRDRRRLAPPGGPRSPRGRRPADRERPGLGPPARRRARAGGPHRGGPRRASHRPRDHPRISPTSRRSTSPSGPGTSSSGGRSGRSSPPRSCACSTPTAPGFVAT
jgi:hypothetical protein